MPHPQVRPCLPLSLSCRGTPCPLRAWQTLFLPVFLVAGLAMALCGGQQCEKDRNSELMVFESHTHFITFF